MFIHLPTPPLPPPFDVTSPYEMAERACVQTNTREGAGKINRAGGSVLVITQREGMGQLEYTRPCLPHVSELMTDGCAHLLYHSSGFHQLAAGQPLSGQPVRHGKASGMARPSRTKAPPPCRVALYQPARRPAALDQPSSLRPHWSSPTYGNASTVYRQSLARLKRV
jgi:hypothetical protein